MFIMTMPLSFKIGDTADVRINGKPTKLTWRERDTLVINGDDARRIMDVRKTPDGKLLRFHCADAGDTTSSVLVTRQQVGDVVAEQVTLMDAVDGELRRRMLVEECEPVLREAYRRALAEGMRTPVLVIADAATPEGRRVADDLGGISQPGNVRVAAVTYADMRRLMGGDRGREALARVTDEPGKFPVVVYSGAKALFTAVIVG